jgi:NADH-quinone oxidoreductase subunit E
VTVLSQDFRAKAQEIVARYPVARSALLMLLHEAQDEVGFVSDDVIREVADVMDLTPADVEGVATFYTMYKRKHPGRFLISVCTNLSCAINGAEETAEAMRAAIGPPHQATPDGLCSWESVECLATCHWAVAAQLNYLDIPYLTPERAVKLVDDLRTGRDVEEILADLRSAGSLAEARGGGAPATETAAAPETNGEAAAPESNGSADA